MDNMVVGLAVERARTSRRSTLLPAEEEFQQVPKDLIANFLLFGIGIRGVQRRPQSDSDEDECDHLNWPRSGLLSSRISAPLSCRR